MAQRAAASCTTAQSAPLKNGDWWIVSPDAAERPELGETATGLTMAEGVCLMMPRRRLKAIRWQQPRPLVSSCPSQVMCPNPLPHCCPAALLSAAPRLLAVAVPERKPRCRQLRPGLTFSMYRRAAGSARRRAVLNAMLVWTDVGRAIH